VHTRARALDLRRSRHYAARVEQEGSFLGSHSAPDSVGFVSIEGVFLALHSYWALAANGLRSEFLRLQVAPAGAVWGEEDG
jgi:hypothetical protein